VEPSAKSVGLNPFKQSAKMSLSPQDGVGILHVGANKEIQILGCARLGMYTESMAVDDEILDRTCVECTEKIF
jgi:hypothetical protein